VKPRDSYVVSKCAEIEALLDEAVGWSKDDDKLGAHLASYITVLISGMVEDCIEFLVKQRAGKGGDFEVQELVGKLVDRQFRNPSHQQIRDMMRWFSEEYARSYHEKVPSDAPDALGSIVANRISLAHTGTWKQQMTIGDVRNYFTRIMPILIAVEEVLA